MDMNVDVPSLQYGGIVFFDHPCPTASHWTVESNITISISNIDSPGCQQFFLSFHVCKQ